MHNPFTGDSFSPNDKNMTAGRFLQTEHNTIIHSPSPACSKLKLVIAFIHMNNTDKFYRISYQSLKH